MINEQLRDFRVFKTIMVLQFYYALHHYAARRLTMAMGIPLKDGSKTRRYFVEFTFNWKKKKIGISLANLSQMLSTSCPSKTMQKKKISKKSFYL